MSQPASISAARSVRSDVESAIGRAARATGTDFSYLLAQAKLESGLNPAAQAATSSAAGLFQFTRGTWLQTIGAHGAEHGLGWAKAAIGSGQIADPATRAQILALRLDPQAAALMAGALANDNRSALTTQLGREPDPPELYLAHFLGTEGAGRFLAALASDPAQSAASLLPRAAAANHATFFNAAGADRSLSEVMGLIRTRIQAAMAGPGSFEPPPEWFALPAGEQLPVFDREQQPRSAAPVRASMAETLASAFGIGAQGDAPAHVRLAYGRLQAFGL